MRWRRIRIWHSIPRRCGGSAISWSTGWWTGVARSDDAVNRFDRGLQLTRPARAIALWLSIKSLGLAPFRDALDAALDHALYAQELIEAHDNGDIFTAAALGIVTFRRRDGRDEDAVRQLNASGVGHVSSTVLEGEVTLRLCINSFRTTRRDVEIVVERLLGALEE